MFPFSVISDTQPSGWRWTGPLGFHPPQLCSCLCGSLKPHHNYQSRRWMARKVYKPQKIWVSLQQDFLLFAHLTLCSSAPTQPISASHLTMPPRFNKHRLSHRSSSPGELVSATRQPIKRIKEEPSSNGEVHIPSHDPLNVGDSDFEDVYIPRAERDRDAASDAESQVDFEEDGEDESDGGLRALVSRAKQARAGRGKQARASRGKWDADAKRARWNEKYGAMKAEEAVGACFNL